MDNIDERYKNGKIYTITVEDGSIYVGSTISTLNKRFISHKTQKQCSMYQYIHNNYNKDWSKCKIELYEKYPCNNKKELTKKEGEIIKLFGTINKVIAGKTKEEYYNDNIEEMIIKNKEYYNDNKEKILEINKKYRNDNKQKIQEYERNRPNKQERAENQKQKIVCECGCISTRKHLPRHKRTIKHKELMEQQIESILSFIKSFS